MLLLLRKILVTATATGGAGGANGGTDGEDAVATCIGTATVTDTGIAGTVGGGGGVYWP